MIDHWNATVLVVEDELFIRAAAAEMLTDAGFNVLQAKHAAEALVVFEQHDDIAVLFTDINMPGSMDGLRLAEVVKQRRPPIQILVTSGLIEPNIGDLPDGGKFIRKPYDFDKLKRTIRELANTATS
jgi:CheY-like chemotaxis protein